MIRSLRIIFSLACIVLGFTLSSVKAQSTLVGLVSCAGEPVSFATITIPNSRIGIAADAEGKFKFENLPTDVDHARLIGTGSLYLSGSEQNDSKALFVFTG